MGDDRWPLGRCAIAPDNLGPAIVKADCYRIRLDERVSMLCGHLSVGSPVSVDLPTLARGSTRARLNTDLARAATLPLASRTAQQHYITRVQDAMVDSESGRELLEQSVGLLAEYKQSLITAAVTGELDVTTAGSGIPG